MEYMRERKEKIRVGNKVMRVKKSAETIASGERKHFYMQPVSFRDYPVTGVPKAFEEVNKIT